MPVIGKQLLEKKTLEMIESSRGEIIGITNTSSILNYRSYLPFFMQSRNISIRVLTNAKHIDEIKLLINPGINIKFLSQKRVSKMLVVQEQALLEIGCRELEETWNFGIWTNHKEILNNSRERFEVLWNKAETNKP